MVSRFAWHREGVSETELNGFLINALVDMKACLLLQDAEERYICITALPPPFEVSKTSEPDEQVVFGQELAGLLVTARAEARITAASAAFEFLHPNGLVFEFRVFCNRLNSGLDQFITIVVDRTADRRDRAAMNELLREINHRSKNLLAIIQSIANQTARHITDIEIFSRRFRGRIQSLARSQDIVTDSGWKGAMLSEILVSEISSRPETRLRSPELEGDDILLSPNAALHVGLAINELTTLSSERDGPESSEPFVIECRLFIMDGRTHARLAWHETTARGSRMPLLARGDLMLVSTILERIVPSALNGTCALSIGEEASAYEIEFPL